MKRYDIDINGDVTEAASGEYVKWTDVATLVQTVKLWYEDARESRREDGLGTSMRNTYDALEASGMYPEDK